MWYICLSIIFISPINAHMKRMRKGEKWQFLSSISINIIHAYTVFNSIVIFKDIFHETLSLMVETRFLLLFPIHSIPIQKICAFVNWHVRKMKMEKQLEVIIMIYCVRLLWHRNNDNKSHKMTANYKLEAFLYLRLGMMT